MAFITYFVSSRTGLKNHYPIPARNYLTCLYLVFTVVLRDPDSGIKAQSAETISAISIVNLFRI